MLVSFAGWKGGTRETPAQRTANPNVCWEHSGWINVDVGLHQGAKRLQLRGQPETEEEEEV